MRKYFTVGVFIAVMITIVWSCEKEKSGVEDNFVFAPTATEIEIPFNFPNMKIPNDNLPTLEAIALGRMLYYDPILHKTQAMSCASCHDQSKAFTTYESNSLAHINLGWNNQFLWNGNIKGSLEAIMKYEVEEFFETDIALLNSNQIYRQKFKEAYNTNSITSQHVAYALAQFFRTLNSTDSKYDRWLRGEVMLTPEEFDGLEIFNSERGDCFHCHGTVLFHDNGFGNNGLDLNPDPGLFEVTGNASDFGKFKTPTLRNIELTAPYMHDGRYETLEEVIEFYSYGVQHNSPNLSPLMKYSANGGVQLNPHEIQNLIAFLKTLTDETFISKEELADPH